LFALARSQLTSLEIPVVGGNLSEIIVTNTPFSVRTIAMRAFCEHLLSLPPSRPGVFRRELDRANANKDRQIYPQIEPGEAPGTSRLILDVKDRVPIHAKAELNNQNSREHRRCG